MITTLVDVQETHRHQYAGHDEITTLVTVDVDKTLTFPIAPEMRAKRVAEASVEGLVYNMRAVRVPHPFARIWTDLIRIEVTVESSQEF